MVKMGLLQIAISTMYAPSSVIRYLLNRPDHTSFFQVLIELTVYLTLRSEIKPTEHISKI